MAAEYDFREKPNPKGDHEKQPFHPRIVLKGKISTEHMIRDITQSSTLSPGDIVAVLRMLSERISFYVSEGYNVELGDMGYFTASLTSRPVMDKKEIRSPSVNFNGVNFRPKAKFKKSIQGKLVRASKGFNISTNITEEERKKKVNDYLDTHSYITRKAYSELTGRLKNVALKDLNGWVKEGYLERHGSRSSLIFTKKNN